MNARVPQGATGMVQPLDEIAVDSEFNGDKAVDRLATEAMTQNPDHFLTGKVTANEKRIRLYQMDRPASLARYFSPSARYHCRSFVKCGNRLRNSTA